MRIRFQGLRVILSGTRRYPAIRALLLVGPAIGWILAFSIVPLFIVIGYSFLTSGGSGAILPTITVENYTKLWTTSLYRRVLLESLLIGVEATVITMLLGYPVAYRLGRLKSRFTPLLVLLVLLPFWTSYLVRIFAWLVMLMDNGVINWFLLSLKLIANPIQLLFTHLGVVIGIVYSALPFAILPIYAVIAGIDEDLISAAKVLGANDQQTFREVVFPLSVPGLAAGVILTFIYAVGSFLAPAILGGNSAVMIANIIATAFLELFNWPFASALTVSLLIVMLIVLGVTTKVVSLDTIYGAQGK